MIKKIDQLLDQAVQGKRMKLAVASAQDTDVLESLMEAEKLGIITPVLVGDREEIERIAKEIGYDISQTEIVDVAGLEEQANEAVRLVSEGKADFLMKGLVDTSIILKALLKKEYGLRTGSLLSHVMVYESSFYDKLLFLTDGGMNILPSLEEKVSIIRNAVRCTRSFGYAHTHIACLAAKEKVSEKMQATVDAAKLQELSQQGEFGEDVIVEGPLALDIAVSREAANIKGFKSKISGDVDVLLVPSIEMGNGIGKCMTYLGGAKSAGVIVGAKVPVVMTSRADSSDVKLSSIAFGVLVSRFS